MYSFIFHFLTKINAWLHHLKSTYFASICNIDKRIYTHRVICAPSVSRHSTERIDLPYKYYMNRIVCSSSFINNLNRLLFFLLTLLPLFLLIFKTKVHIKWNLDFIIFTFFCWITCLRNQENVNAKSPGFSWNSLCFR